MDRQSAGRAALDPLQKAEKFLMAMTWHTVAQHLTAQHVQGCEQGRSSMAGVIMRLPLGDPRTQGQNRLGTIQGLDLALLIHAQHQSFLWRIQVQADDVVQLVKEPGIGAQLEALYAMRLQTMCLPDAIDSRRTHPLGSGQHAHAPMRRSRGFAVQSGVHNRLFFLPRQAPLTSRSRRIFQQPLQSGPFKTLAPAQHRRSTGAQLCRQAVVGHPVGRTQHDADTKCDLLWGGSRPHKTFQQLPLFPTEMQWLGSFPHGCLLYSDFRVIVTLLMKHYTSSALADSHWRQAIPRWS